MKMKVEILVKETIKPSSPTPNHLQPSTAPTFYTEFVIFYYTTTSLASQCLKKSLLKVLTLFYLVAGRTKDHFTVDCNDSSVEYVEAQINRKISNIFQQPNVEALSHFVPFTSVSTSPTKVDPLWWWYWYWVGGRRTGERLMGLNLAQGDWTDFAEHPSSPVIVTNFTCRVFKQWFYCFRN